MTIILNDAILTSFRHLIMTSYFSFASWLEQIRPIYNYITWIAGLG